MYLVELEELSYLRRYSEYSPLVDDRVRSTRQEIQSSCESA